MLNGGKLAGNRQMDRRFLLIKIWPYGGVCLCPGAISVYITIIFKPLLRFSETSFANQSQASRGASIGSGDESLYKWSRSHDQDYIAD